MRDNVEDCVEINAVNFSLGMQWHIDPVSLGNR